MPPTDRLCARPGRARRHDPGLLALLVIGVGVGDGVVGLRPLDDDVDRALGPPSTPRRAQGCDGSSAGGRRRRERRVGAGRGGHVHPRPRPLGSGRRQPFASRARGPARPAAVSAAGRGPGHPHGRPRRHVRSASSRCPSPTASTHGLRAGRLRPHAARPPVGEPRRDRRHRRGLLGLVAAALVTLLLRVARSSRPPDVRRPAALRRRRLTRAADAGGAHPRERGGSPARGSRHRRRAAHSSTTSSARRTGSPRSSATCCSWPGRDPPRRAQRRWTWARWRPTPCGAADPGGAARRAPVGPADPAVVPADRERLVQLVLILLDNAIDHSPDGGTVRCASLRRHHRAGAGRGPGIPATSSSASSSRSRVCRAPPARRGDRPRPRRRPAHRRGAWRDDPGGSSVDGRGALRRAPPLHRVTSRSTHRGQTAPPGVTYVGDDPPSMRRYARPLQADQMAVGRGADVLAHLSP